MKEEKPAFKVGDKVKICCRNSFNRLGFGIKNYDTITNNLIDGTLTISEIRIDTDTYWSDNIKKRKVIYCFKEVFGYYLPEDMLMRIF